MQSLQQDHSEHDLKQWRWKKKKGGERKEGFPTLVAKGNDPGRANAGNKHKSKTIPLQGTATQVSDPSSWRAMHIRSMAAG